MKDLKTRADVKAFIRAAVFEIVQQAVEDAMRDAQGRLPARPAPVNDDDIIQTTRGPVRRGDIKRKVGRN